MRVRVSYVVEVGEAMRRGIRAHYGKSGLASREEIKSHYEMHGGTEDDDFVEEGSDALAMEREGIPEDQWYAVLEERRREAFLGDEDN